MREEIQKLITNGADPAVMDAACILSDLLDMAEQAGQDRAKKGEAPDPAGDILIYPDNTEFTRDLRLVLHRYYMTGYNRVGAQDK